MHHYPSRSELSRWVIAGFISGAVSVLIYQGAAAPLHALKWTARAPYSMAPTKPWGFPQLWSIAFWGGIWGVLLAVSLARLDRLPLVLAALVFGAVLPTLVAWFVVVPLKGQPMAAGGVPTRMLVGVIVNGAWGLGTGIGMALFDHRRAKRTREIRAERTGTRLGVDSQHPLEEEIMLKPIHFIGLAAAAFISEASAQTIGFATLPPGSILHAQASVIAKVVQDNSKLQVRVIGYGGDTGILESVASKKADFWLLDVGESADAMHGRGTWKGNPKPNLRTAITMYGFQMAFWVRKDSNINTIADLKGKRVPAEWVQQTGVIPHTTAVLAAGGVTYDEVIKVPEVNVVRAADDFKAGKLDLLFFAVGAPKVAEVAASVGGLRLLPMNAFPDSEARMKKVRQEYYFSTVNPAPHIAGIDKPSPVQTIDVVVGVGAHVTDDVVSQFVKAMRENKKGLVAGHPNFNQFDETQAGKPQPTLPHHPAAIKYFKEVGIWRG